MRFAAPIFPCLRKNSRMFSGSFTARKIMLSPSVVVK